MLFTTEAPFANLLAPPRRRRKAGKALEARAGRDAKAPLQEGRRAEAEGGPKPEAERNKERNITRVPNMKGEVKFRVQLRCGAGGV